jgi:hypothetical protein
MPTGLNTGKSPAHVRRNVERADLFARGYGTQRALARVRDEDDVVRDRELLSLETLAYHEVLRHRLSRTAGLRRDDEQRSRDRQAIQQRRDRERVDVVEHVQARPVLARLGVKLVPVRLSQRGPQRDRSQRGSADSEDDNVVEPPACVAHEAGGLRVQRGVVRQLQEAELRGLASPVQLRVRAREERVSRRPLLSRDSAAHGRSEHVGVVEVDHVSI